MLNSTLQKFSLTIFEVRFNFKILVSLFKLVCACSCSNSHVTDHFERCLKLELNFRVEFIYIIVIIILCPFQKHYISMKNPQHPSDYRSYAPEINVYASIIVSFQSFLWSYTWLECPRLMQLNWGGTKSQ